MVLTHMKEKLTELIGEIDEHTFIYGRLSKATLVTVRLYKFETIIEDEQYNNTQSNVVLHTYFYMYIYYT